MTATTTTTTTTTQQQHQQQTSNANSNHNNNYNEICDRYPPQLAAVRSHTHAYSSSSLMTHTRAHNDRIYHFQVKFRSIWVPTYPIGHEPFRAWNGTLRPQSPKKSADAGLVPVQCITSAHQKESPPFCQWLQVPCAQRIGCL